MMRKEQALLLSVRIFSDLLAVLCAWLFSYYLRFHTFLEAPKGVPALGLYLKLIPFILIIWLVVFFFAGFYRRSQTRRSPLREAIDIIQVSGGATLALIGFSYFYEEYRYSRITLVVFAITVPIGIITARSLLRKALRFRRRRVTPRKILVIGSGRQLDYALMVGHQSIMEHLTFAAAILVGSKEDQALAEQRCHELAIPVFPVPENWPGFLSQQGISKVVIAVPARNSNFIEEHMEAIADQVTDVQIVPDIVRFSRFAPGFDLIHGVPVISLHESPLAGPGTLYKRSLDVLGAVVALLIFAPLMAVLAILIPLFSPGPILYRQERMGLDGRTFHILKFRSMPVNAESATGAVWAHSKDNRPTLLGKFLRRSSFDELPQLFNVLRGDMSLVGPRPERPVFVDQFREKVPGYMLRHKVKAGMTGWAQVNGWRGNTSIQKRIECDLFYIQNWSLWLDIKIILLTFIKGFLSKNAY